MKHTFNNGRALVVGIADYDLAGKLPKTILKDAQDISSILQDSAYCGYLSSNVRLLLDREATKAEIVSGLEWLAQTASKDDTVVIYFSGHGAQCQSALEMKTYLCPVDFDGARLQATGLSTEEFSLLIEAIPAARVAVLLDSCYAAAAGVFKSGTGDEIKWGFGGPALDKLGHGIGRVILASSTAEEFSMALGAMDNSLFTHFILAGLKGAVHYTNDGVIRVLDLFTYVATEVPKKANQHPVLKANTQDNFPIALLRGGVKNAGYTLSDAGLTSNRAATPALEVVLTSLYPSGPMDSEIWPRAGGDISALKPGMAGKAAWYSAIRMVRQGGGGAGISLSTLLETALEDFPNNPELKAVLV
jgi:hypothetical protein